MLDTYNSLNEYLCIPIYVYQAMYLIRVHSAKHVATQVPVSYTHLDVYKRQVRECVCVYVCVTNLTL